MNPSVNNIAYLIRHTYTKVDKHDFERICLWVETWRRLWSLYRQLSRPIRCAIAIFSAIEVWGWLEGRNPNYLTHQRRFLDAHSYSSPAPGLDGSEFDLRTIPVANAAYDSAWEALRSVRVHMRRQLKLVNDWLEMQRRLTKLEQQIKVRRLYLIVARVAQPFLLTSSGYKILL